MIAFLVILSRCDGWGGIAMFTKFKEKWLNKFVKLPNIIPSYDTLQRIVLLLNTKTLYSSCIKFLIEKINNLTIKDNVKNVFSMDEKVSNRRGRNKENIKEIKALNTMNVYSHNYGVPSVWYYKECGDVMIPEDKELPLNSLEHNPHGACKCGCKEFIPETAVMDTWATSSVSPFINMKYGEDDERKFLYPMSMRNHAHEIIRTWTFYSIVKSLYHTGQVPWKDLMISGCVLAKKGEKISKSKNNAKMSPNDLLDTYGADMIRYWTASNKLGTDKWFDTKDIESSKRFMNKLWDSAKFIDMHIKDADLSEEAKVMKLVRKDKKNQ